MPRRSARLAGSRPVRASPAADPESPPANEAIGKHENSPGTDPEESDEEPVRPQKRRKQPTSNTPSLDPSLQLKNVRGRRGALKDIVEMPLDVLHEIFMYLTLIELLSLSRMCKALRRILLTKSAEYVWKQARLNLDEFPDCPDDLNEVQFASLIFTPLCDYCDTAKGRYFIWSIRRSYCVACFNGKKGLIRLYGFTEGSMKYPDILPVIPSIDQRDKKEYLQIRDNYLILQAHAYQLLGKFKKFGKKARAIWIQELKDERERRIIHGHLCEKWLKMQGDKRTAQLVAIRKRRYEAIKQRLTDLGWGKELKTIKEMESWPSVRQPKDLTDRIWQNIKDDIIKKMENHRAYRLQEDYLAAQRERRNNLIKYIDNLQQSNLGKVILPDIHDLESTEPIKRLIKAPTEETIEFPESLVLELTQNWRTSCDTVLRNMVVADATKSGKPNDADPLPLATTFFTCRIRCQVFQYPEVLSHICATTISYRERCPWDGKRIFFSDQAYSLARTLLKVSGFDPDITTRKDVQWPALIVECHECQIIIHNDSRALMSWPAAIRHAIMHDNLSQHPRMTRAHLSDAELEAVHQHAVEELTRYKDVSCYQCKPCFRDGSYWIKSHTQTRHKDPDPDLMYTTGYTLGLESSGFYPQPQCYIFLERSKDEQGIKETC